MIQMQTVISKPAMIGRCIVHNKQKGFAHFPRMIYLSVRMLKSNVWLWHGARFMLTKITPVIIGHTVHEAVKA